MNEPMLFMNNASIGAPLKMIRAAQYLRMSTFMQDCSIEHQRAYIQAFALRHGFIIVMDYVDAGCSGTDVEYRPEFQRMIADIEAGNTDFDVVLVYDMSRFGRFQIETEGPYYQHKLRMHQIRLVQCTKEYNPQRGPYEGLIDYLDMIEAGRHSSKLSNRVYEAQKNFVGFGFRQGGVPGYGLRRVQVDGRGNLRHEGKFLSHNQRKDYPTDRIVLALGPEEEVGWVRWIYRQFIEHRKTAAHIAIELNAQGILSDYDRPWTASMVQQILANEKYVGNNVYNRISSRLEHKANGIKSLHNPPEQWMRYDKAYPAIVDDALFEQAQGLINARRRTLWKDDQMLALLSNLYKEKGLLSGVLIEEKEQMPTQAAYRKRFGSLVRAYRLVGYTPNRDYRYLEINQQLRRVHGEMWSTVKDTIAGYGAEVEEDAACDLLTIDDEYTVSIVIARCQRRPSGSYHWMIRFDTSLRPDYTIAVRMHPGNETIRDYYILPLMALRRDRMHLNEYNDLSLDAYRFNTLDMLFAASRNTAIMEAAA